MLQSVFKSSYLLMQKVVPRWSHGHRKLDATVCEPPTLDGAVGRRRRRRHAREADDRRRDGVRWESEWTERRNWRFFLIATQWFKLIGNFSTSQLIESYFYSFEVSSSRNCSRVKNQNEGKVKVSISDVADSFYGCVKNIKVNNRFLLATDMTLQGNVLPNSCPNWREVYFKNVINFARIVSQLSVYCLHTLSSVKNK